jgi:hypothetical protein
MTPAERAKEIERNKKQNLAALKRDQEREAREYLRRGGGSRVAKAEARRILGKDALDLIPV